MDKTHIEEKTEECIYQKDATREPAYTEAGGEFVLPEYLPEIRKVLHVSARAVPDGKFISEGKAEFDGTLLYNVIYSDKEGNALSFSQSSDFEIMRDIPKEASKPKVSYNFTCTRTTYRLGGPRKITLKTNIRCDSHVLYKATLPFSCPDDENTECLTSYENTAKTLLSEEKDVLLSDTFNIDTYMKDTVNMIACDPTVIIREAKCAQGLVTLCGELIIKCMFSPTGESAFYETRKIPFEENLTTKGVAAGMCAVGYGVCVSLDTSCDDMGSGVQIALDATLRLSSSVGTDLRLLIPEDVYSTKYKEEVKYEDMCFSSFLGCDTLAYSSQSVISDLKGEVPGSVSNCYLSCTLYEITEENKKAKIALTITADVICSVASDVPEIQYAVFEKTDTYYVNTNLTCRENCNYEVTATPGAIRARIEGEKIVCDFEIGLLARAFETKTKRVSVSYKTTSEEYEKQGEIAVIYPQGQSLFSLAKEHRVSTKELKETNGLSDEVLENKGSTSSLDGISSIVIDV